MAITSSFLNEMAEIFKSRVDSISFKLNGALKTVPVTEIKLTGSIVTIKGFIDYKHSGTITNLAVISSTGNALITRNDSITKTNNPYPRGLLVIFKFEIKEAL